MLEWARVKPHGAFVFTSNIDGQFQRAGFDPLRVVECHGAIETSQCAAPCGAALWASSESVGVDPKTFRAAPPLPVCPRCGDVARPNVLMFGDDGWVARRTDEQHARLRAWLRTIESESARLAMLELGAGAAVPTLRLTSESLARRLGGTLIRVNPREPEVPAQGIGLSLGALEAIEAMDRKLPRPRS